MAGIPLVRCALVSLIIATFAFSAPNPTGYEDEFFEEINRLFYLEIELFPVDKQKHAMVSKAAFHLADTKSENPFCSGLEAALLVLEVGYEKELGDKGIEDEELVAKWTEMRLLLRDIDDRTQRYGLDTGDLLADLMGVSASLLNYADMELHLQPRPFRK